MADKLIKDSSGRTLGFIRTTPTGRQEAYEPIGNTAAATTVSTI